jgi:hypothetical protein
VVVVVVVVDRERSSLRSAFSKAPLVATSRCLVFVLHALFYYTLAVAMEL